MLVFISHGSYTWSMKKRCSKCRRVLDVSRFVKKGSGTAAQCKDCHKIYYQKAYERPERKKQIREAVDRRRQKLRALIHSLKTGSCADCGKTYPPYVLDFDHREDKIENVSLLVYKRGWSEKRIREEIAKCDLVCANCHRERTFGPA